MTHGDDSSYDVRVWAIRVYKGRRGSSYTVTWLVAGSRNQQTFATRKLAESFSRQPYHRGTRRGAVLRLRRPSSLDAQKPDGAQLVRPRMRVHGHEVGARITWSPQEPVRCAGLGYHGHGE